MLQEINVIPLPPRNTKPKLIDKPRHFRKYPLVLPENEATIDGNAKAVPEIPSKQKINNIYHNFSNFQNLPIKLKMENGDASDTKVRYHNLNCIVDSVDGAVKLDTSYGVKNDHLVFPSTSEAGKYDVACASTVNDMESSLKGLNIFNYVILHVFCIN